MAEVSVIDAHGLTKRYAADVLAVNNLDLRVRRGEIYGFLGPNGAGKTTTMRMLTGLIRPTAGTATVVGYPPGSSQSLQRLGAMVEVPAFYPYLSGRDNLRVMARYNGATSARIEAVLKQVELSDRAHHKFKTYSTGMKQRLGVAAALLKDPELLILDEPTSGLDPQGTVDMRALIRGIASQGRTVLLSSHLLNEVEQICNRVGVVVRGHLVAEGTVDELRGRGGLVVRAAPADKARAVLDQVAPGQVHTTNGRFALTVDPAQAAMINRRLVESGVEVSELREVERSLEEVFLQLTEGAAGEQTT
jgi:ABC-type multidrug transport system ATPase subunit